jgi:hypothetical protein
MELTPICGQTKKPSAAIAAVEALGKSNAIEIMK